MKVLWGQEKYLRVPIILFILWVLLFAVFESSHRRAAKAVPTDVAISAAIPAQPREEPILLGRTLAPTPAVEATSVAVRTPIPQTSPETIDKKISHGKETLFAMMLKPLIVEAAKRRERHNIEDPNSSSRIDEALNRDRVNFLIFVSGETHEPPLEWGIIASPSIVSINHVEGAIDIVSLTHDIRAPEVSQELGIKGLPQSAQRLDQALLNEKVGGFRLTRRVLENATGLAIDFQIHAKDNALEKLVDNVFAGVTVDLPIQIGLGPYFMRKIKYDEEGRVFRQGKTRLNGRETVGFIKSIPLVGPKDKTYSPLMEHNVRKAMVFRALQEMIKTKFSAKLLFDSGNYAVDVVTTKDIAYDFDQNELVTKNLGQVIPIAARLAVGVNYELTEIPPLRKQLYIVDRCCSTDPENMPVHWANWVGPGEESIRQDWRNGVFRTDIAYQIPYGANPYGDLVTEYWQAVRAYVKRSLLSK